MIESSINGLVKRDQELLESVEQSEEPKANELDIRLDELCTSLIAQYQPMAKDLRIILMIFKMNEELETNGGPCGKYFQSSLCLLETPAVKPLIDIPEMAAVAAQMVQDSITAFINEDAAAGHVSVRAGQHHRQPETIKPIRNLIEVMSADPR